MPTKFRYRDTSHDNGESVTMQEPNDYVRHIAKLYAAERSGLAPIITGHYVHVDAQAGQRIAVLYDALPEYSPEALDAYKALACQLVDQWHWAENAGIRFEAWQQNGQPYSNSAELCRDVAEHNHLYFFTGGDPHPLLDVASGIRDYTINDIFRAVHDLFGHAAEGYQFGPRGEHNAWIHHSMMFSPLAQQALTTETRGQNSWVNYGPHSDLPVTERPYAQQKAALLPDWCADWRKCLAEE